MKETLHARIGRDLTNHPPANDAVIDSMVEIRELGKQLAHRLIDLCPEGRELSVALTGVEQAVMFGVAALARDGH